MGLVRRAWVSFAAAAPPVSSLVPAAHAALGFQGLSAAPANTDAGAQQRRQHPHRVHGRDRRRQGPDGRPPAGLVGDPTATPLCTSTQLQSDACPSASQVGTVTAKVDRAPR